MVAFFAALGLRRPLGTVVTVGFALGFATGAGAPLAALVPALFAATAGFEGAAVFLGGFGAIDVFVDFAGIFATTRKFSGFVASIPMTRR